LAACAENRAEDFDDAYYINISKGVSKQYKLSTANGLLSYTDFYTEDFAPMPLCAKLNCTHNSEICTAFSLKEARCPFYYGENLYYFIYSNSNICEFYRAETDGTNQSLILKFDDNFNLEQVSFFNKKLVVNMFQEVIIDGNYGRNYRIYIYDFSKLKLIYETGIKYEVGINHIGIIDDYLYLQYSGRDYPVDVPLGESIWDYMGDKDSIFYKDYVMQFWKMPLEQKNHINPEYETIDAYQIYIFDEYYYVLVDESSDILYKTNAVTGETDVFFEGFNGMIDMFEIIDDKIFMRIGNFRLGESRWIYYDGHEFISVENATSFVFDFEVGEYIFGFYEGKQGYIKKSDFYDGMKNFVEYLYSSL
jgi:hypothetical protein